MKFILGVRDFIASVCMLILRPLCKLLGLHLYTSDDLRSWQGHWQYQGQEKLKSDLKPKIEISSHSLSHLRDLTHNLPHLIGLPKPEADFAKYVLCLVWYIHDPDRLKRFSLEVSPYLKKKYLNQRAIVCGQQVTEETFERIEQGCYASAMFLTKVIFGQNLSAYQVAPDWYQEDKAVLQAIKERLTKQLVNTERQIESLGNS